MSSKNKFINISELIEEYGSLGNIIEKIQDYKLEAYLKDYQLFINGEEINNDDFLIRSDSLFVENLEKINLEDNIIIDIQLIRSFEQFSSCYENIKIKIRDIFITLDSLEVNRENPEIFAHAHTLGVTITFPLRRKEDNYSRFRYVQNGSEKFQLSKNQAKILWYLWKMNQNGVTDVETFDILNFAGVDILKVKVRDIFRSDDGPKVLNNIIIQSSKRGRWILLKSFVDSL